MSSSVLLRRSCFSSSFFTLINIQAQHQMGAKVTNIVRYCLFVGWHRKRSAVYCREFHIESHLKCRVLVFCDVAGVQQRNKAVSCLFWMPNYSIYWKSQDCSYFPLSSLTKDSFFAPFDKNSYLRFKENSSPSRQLWRWYISFQCLKENDRVIV